MKFHDQTFEQQNVDLDDNVYTGCTFRGCKIIFRGTGDDFQLRANHFDGCTFELQGPAAKTVDFMRKLYQGGAPDVVNGWIAMITQP